VDSANAIVNGGLAGNSLFFGGATAEVTSFANTDNGSWNNDRALSVHSTNPWAHRGGRAQSGSYGGLFAFVRDTGGISSDTIGHRTILSGY
jgi:hypothetical protein